MEHSQFRSGIVKVTFWGITVASLFSHAFNSLNYSNRAQCAAESSLPSESTWMMIDTYNAQKLAFNYAMATGQNPSALVSKASTEYRLAITHLTLSIMNKLMNAELPLLPTDLNSKSNRLTNYQAIVKKCKNVLQCQELDVYLGQLWEASEVNNIQTRSLVLSKIDKITQADFIQQKKNSVSCYLVKDYSALQGHLVNTKPNATDIEKVAQAWLNREKYITNCYSQESSLDQQNFVLQLDLKVNQLNWDEVGFDFWNTTKILTSWAWRKTSNLKQVSQTFHHLFKSTVLEESMMLIPNGCKSITPQACNEKTLSENSIRELAKTEITNSEHFSRMSIGPEKKLIQSKPPEVNTDILGIEKSNNLNVWVSQFRKNLTSARGLSKNKIQNGLQTMDRIYKNINLESIKNRLNQLIQLAREENVDAKKLLHTTCQELRLAIDPRFNFYSRDLELTFQSPILSKINQNPERIPQVLYTYLTQIGQVALPVCDLAARDRLTEVRAEMIEKKDFRPWAQLVIDENQPAIESSSSELNAMGTSAMALLWNPAAGYVRNNVLCSDAVDCMRSYIESAIEIRAAVQYASAFMTHSGDIHSSSLLNPYSELKACQIYDPWLMSKMSIQNLVKDTLNTALFGWNYFPVYLDFTKGVPKVTSLEKILENGTMRFAPQIQEAQYQSNMMLDFGPLVGAPCSLSITDGPAAASQLSQNPYYFTGVTVNYCDTQSQLTNKADDTQTVRSEPQKNTQKCFGCTIGLVSVESMVSLYNSKAVAPIKFSIQVLKTISNFVSARKDTVNIPIGAKVNPEYAARVYQQYNTIPEQCMDQVSRGLSCYQNLCAAQSAHEFESRTGVRVKNTILVPRSGDLAHHETSEYYAYLETDLCDGEIRISVNCSNSKNNYYDFRNLMSFEKSCQSKIPQLKSELGL